ncbi:DNA replication complex GINS protein SLD5 [Blattella germanica]|nr:DNA replication complex GINS protein SLD5 [Blattella germanica]
MDSDNEISFDLSDDEPLTAQKILNTLREVWLNEKFSPELLKHKTEEVDCMMDQINQMEENIGRLKKGDFRVVIHQMEVDRIRYLLSSYLRTRLEKIELYAVKLIEEDSKREPLLQFLSPAELKFAKECLSHMDSHLSLIALRHMPPYVQNFDKEKMAIVPNMASHVFLRAKKNIHGIIVEGDSENRDEEVNLEENSQHIMRYESVAQYLKDGGVQLI